VRALAVHPDVIVVVSGLWQTTATAVRHGEEGFLIDSPPLPEELEALPSLLEQAGFPLSGLLATHGDWDHLLGSLAFPRAALGVGERTAARLRASPGEPQRRLRAFDAEWYLQRRVPLSLGELQALPVPGRLSIGVAAAAELELHEACGHTADGLAVWIPWAGVLICGDYLSPVEIPMVSTEAGGSAVAYRQTLERLAPLVERAATVVPGHGTPMPAARAKEILAQDRAYVEQLIAGGEVSLPPGRRSATQRQIHARNLSSRAQRPRSASPLRAGS
jgi:glyoxylase-like metal-dependent hydrolase (beta-lactamase superfamily II)